MNVISQSKTCTKMINCIYPEKELTFIQSKSLSIKKTAGSFLTKQTHEIIINTFITTILLFCVIKFVFFSETKPTKDVAPTL